MLPPWATAPEEGREDWREAAVLILLHPYGEDWGLPLLLRSEDLPHHRGQMGLPGGAREALRAGLAPESLEETALRETEEEIGVGRGEIEILGTLSRLNITRSGFSVLPFVAWTGLEPSYRLQESEVAALIETPLSRITGPGVEEEAEILVDGGPRRVPCYRVEGHIVWGATAMILAELSSVLAAI
jgi:8-oxo-dGTP pyrophosphatase MutT (NUDIX family)